MIVFKSGVLREKSALFFPHLVVLYVKQVPGTCFTSSLHFVVSLSEKRRVAHRETTFLLLQKDELLKKYPFYFGSSEKLLIFALGEINFQENEKIRDC